VSQSFFKASTPISASAVVSARSGGILHGILLNSVAATATIQLYDGGTVAVPLNAITGLWTPGAITVPTFIPLDLELNNGLVIVIAVAAANLTPIGRL
jgi:hypothetical protein